MQSDSTIYPPPVPNMIEFKLVEDFPGYAVSYDYIRAYVWTCKRNDGPRPSINGPKWREMKPSFRKFYFYVGPCRNGKSINRTIHSIVAEAFLGPKPDGCDVCHGIAGKLCNLPSNLYYGTKSQNQRDRVRDDTHQRGERCYFNVLTEAQAREIFEIRQRTGMSHSKIAKMFNVHTETVGMMLRGKSWAWLGLAGKMSAPS